MAHTCNLSIWEVDGKISSSKPYQVGGQSDLLESLSENNSNKWSIKMSQQVEVPASQPDELSLTAGIYGELRELTPYKVFADLHINAQK